MQNVNEVRHFVTLFGEDVFDDWLTRLGDARAQANIAARINPLAAGNFGACKPLSEGVFELRIDWGPGYKGLLRDSRAGLHFASVQGR